MGWNFEILIFHLILLSLEEEVNLGSLGWKRREASLSLGKEEKERFNHLTIDLSSRSRCVSFSRSEERSGGVSNVFVFFSSEQPCLYTLGSIYIMKFAIDLSPRSRYYSKAKDEERYSESRDFARFYLRKRKTH